jgi:hypothetical protein
MKGSHNVVFYSENAFLDVLQRGSSVHGGRATSIMAGGVVCRFSRFEAVW